ncbi:MAG: 3'-5' exoribonuclease YhaM family protein [Planctomycetaceae bacterium]
MDETRRPPDAQPALFPVPAVRRLCEFASGESGDCFALLVGRESATTRDGKPYYRVQFRDATRTVTAMVWNDSAWFADCERNWKPGNFYKIRCRYSDTQYGPQIDVDRIRETTPEDAAEGFDPADFFESTRFDAAEMFDELVALAEANIDEAPLRELTVKLLTDNGEEIRRIPAATRNHHAFIGGYIEHVLSVTKTALFLAEKYRELYPDMQPPLSKPLVVAGAILHDVGKLKELTIAPQGAEYTAEGRLVGHILLGRDIVREAAREVPELDAETLLRLEHIIIAHQNLPEWGSPIAPHTPEALLVHYADDVDAKFQMVAGALTEPPSDEEAEFTGRHNALRRGIFRGLRRDE